MFQLVQVETMMLNKDITKEVFQTYGAVHVKKLIDPDLAKFLSHVLLRNSSRNANGDEQVPTAMTVMEHEILFETLLERVWPLIEIALDKELIPTYAYARLYKNGNILEKHTDRPACEISVTLQLGRSHHYSWPIYMGKNRYDLAEGDAVIYQGCDIEHWREPCDGPEGYYSGQVFLHFVDKNGPYIDQFADNTKRDTWTDMFVKFRSHQMDEK